MAKFVLLAVAEAVADEVNVLLTSSRPRLFYRRQLEESAGSISSNIREGLGRREGPERNQFYRYARGSAEETDDRLTRNFVAKRLKPTTYWRLHNRLVLIIKTINKLLGDDWPQS
ncbi:MAG: four helix bundle protein [Gemmatimonadaceae bacterium]